MSFPRLKTRIEWMEEDDPGFFNTEPSIVEPAHNLSLEEILRDYSRGIVHTTRTPLYDEGDDVPDDLEEFDDIVDILPTSVAQLDKASAENESKTPIPPDSSDDSQHTTSQE